MLNVAIEAAREAGRYLKYNVGRVRNVETKKGEVRNLVSEIDRGSEEKIISFIRSRYPSHAILAEESGAQDSKADYKWIIDPLDGTTNYLHGVPVYCVTIALEHRGEVVAGVVYDPNLDELFTAEKGAGAYMNGKRLRVSDTGDLIDGLLVTGFPYDIARNPYHTLERFVHVLLAAGGIRRLGSAALDLSYIAAGRFDGFWEVSLNPWDMAAGVLFVREAGGRVTDFSGVGHDIYNKQVLATNGHLHDALLDLLRDPNTQPSSITPAV
ncbi:MAG: inositol monophosphatase [Bacteroidetes bacterium]|nr:inositol monophosphatase [Bacteroidota bacterium]